MSSITVVEDGPRGVARRTLAATGLVAVILAVTAVVAIWTSGQGSADSSVPITVQLIDVGDGLPADSDVKFRGVIVGSVRSVEPGLAGSPNIVQVALDPARAPTIPRSVTARVVPSNLFAVSSIQLLDNGSGPGLAGGDVIGPDRSRTTVQFQTTLSTLRAIVSATARSGDDSTVGLLAAVSSATDRRGDEIGRAGGQLATIIDQLDTALEPTDRSALRALNQSVAGLRTAAPDLLDALHASVVPMRAVAEQSGALTRFLAAGSTTGARVDTALRRNAEQLIRITGSAAPIATVVADGSPSFSGIVTQIGVMSDKWFTTFWPVGQQNANGKFMFQFTPHKLYTRADCPRYGEMEGASCRTAPEVVTAPSVPRSRTGMTPGYRPATMGGNVGSVGSAEEQEALARAVGGPKVTTTLLLGGLARGNDLHISPAGPPRAGGR